MFNDLFIFLLLSIIYTPLVYYVIQDIIFFKEESHSVRIIYLLSLIIMVLLIFLILLEFLKRL
jgi:hypothetical protein